MAEYLGALASAVQLVDVALRASREAYSFLAAVKNAKEDVKELREILRDVEANVRSLRHYANEFQKPKNAVDEFEVLSETITGSFSGFHDDIVALKQILPPKPSPALAEKIKWVYNKRNIGQLTRRLKKRETSLATALSITGRLHGLRIRQDTTILLEQGKATDSIISAQTDVISSNLRTQQHNHDQVLEKLQEANDDVAFARTESHSNNVLLLQHNQHVKDQLLDVQSTAVLHHTATQAAIHKQSNRISDQIREVTRQSTTLMEKIQSSCDALNNIESRTSYPSTSSQLSLEHLTASLGSINTTTMFSASGVNMMTGILRRELHSALEPILEQALNKSESRKEVMLGHLSNAIQAMTSDAGHEMYESDTRSQIPDQVQNQDLCQDGYISDVSGMKGTSYKSELFPNPHVLDDPQYCYMLTRYRRDWSFKWRIGTLHVCICTTRRRMFGFPKGEIHTEFNVYFLPSQALMQMPGFELQHSTGPDQRGFYQLAPKMCFFPVMPHTHPAFFAIKSGNLAELQSLLASGKATLGMRDGHGWTLLHWAATYCASEICQFLTSHGLSWNNKSNSGRTPIQFALYASLTPCHPSSSKDPYRTLKYIPNMRMDIEQLWADDKRIVSYESEGDRDLQKWLKVVDYSLELAYDGWYLLCNLLTHMLYPTWTNLNILQTCLRRGLKPDATIDGKDNENPRPLLFVAMNFASDEKANRQRSPHLSQPPSEVYLGTHEDQSFARNVPPVDLDCIITKLVHAGANTHHMFSEDFDKSLNWRDIETLWTYAQVIDIEEELVAALRMCNIDVDRYFWEDIRIRKQAIRFNGATRSGIDEEVLKLPSISGLRCRACRRNDCWNHYRGILEDREFSY